MGNAMVAADIDRLKQIYADDWATITSSGKMIAKERVLQDFKSGKNKLVSYELGPMDVQVLGNVAVGHGSVTEKRIWDGKDIRGEGVWMDLFEKRASKWGDRALRRRLCEVRELEARRETIGGSNAGSALSSGMRSSCS
jgi:ketosteroid isomerase-like protein